jgi:hypothetical protein
LCGSRASSQSVEQKRDELCGCASRKNRDCATRSVLVNHAAPHHKYDAPDGRNVFQRIAIERNDVRLQTGPDRADLI